MDPNVVPTASFTLDDDHDAVAALSATGARCAVWFRGAERFRGIVHGLRGVGPSGQITGSIRGDLRKLWHWHGRPVPAAALTGQNREYRTYAGTSEQVFKAALSENIARLGIPWTVAPARGLGTNTRVQFRFHPLADKLMPLLAADNLIVELDYDADYNVSVDVRESTIVPGVLTEASGVAGSYTFERTEATATRLIVGGRGEGVARQFVEVRDSVLEADWGDIIESFKDARNSAEGSDLRVDGNDQLRDSAPTSGVSSKLTETASFRYGKTYDVGDQVTVRIGPVDRLQQIGVGISESADNGVLVTPRIGDVDDSPSAVLAKQIARIARAQRDTGRR